MKTLVTIGAGLLLAACNKTTDVGTATAPTVMASANPSGLAPQVNEAPAALDRYERIVRNLEDCPLEGYQIVPTCPGMQMFKAGMANTPADIKALVGHAMIGSTSPAVRLQAAELMTGPDGANAPSQDAIASAAMTERDPGVLQAFIRIVGHAGMKNPRVAAMLVMAADHADKDVRMQAIYALTSPVNRGMTGGAEKLVAMAEHDVEPKVRQAACEYGGRLGSDAMLPLYEKLTASSTDPELYAACMEGLVAMFHNHPSFDTSNEGAYKLFLRRLADKPRTATSPPWNVMSTFCYFSHESDLDKLAAWKQQATWFKPADVKAVMSSVISDKHASWMARAAAVESMVGLGATKAELEVLKHGYRAGDRDDKPVLAKLSSAMAE